MSNYNIVIQGQVDANSVQKSINNMRVQPVIVPLRLSTDQIQQDLRAAFPNVQRQLADITQQIMRTNGMTISPSADMGQVTQAIRQIDGLRNAVVSANGVLTVGDQTLQRYAAGVKVGSNTWQNYQFVVNNATGATHQLNQGLSNTTTAVNRAGDSFGKVVGKIDLWSAATTLIYQPVKAFKEAVEELKRVDSALVSAQKATNATAADMDKLSANSFKYAKNYGRTASEYLNNVTDFARAGFGEQSEELAQLGMLAQNVGEIDRKLATDMLVVANVAWKMNGDVSKLTKVVDVFNETSNRTPSTVSSLAEAMKVSGNVFAEAGVSVEKYTALVAGALEATGQSGSTVGNAMRTALLRIMQVKGAIDEDTGEELTSDDFAKAEAALDKWKISIRGANGTMREFYDIMADIAAVWKTKNVQQQMELLGNISTVSQTNSLIGIFSNWDKVLRNVDIATNSVGSAMEENEIYLNSWEAKSKQLSAAWTEFVSKLVDTDWIKNFLDGATGIIEWLTDTQVILPIIIGLIAMGLTAALIKAGGGLAAFNAQLVLTNILSGGIPLLIGSIVTLVGLGVNWAIQANDTAKQIENLTYKIHDQQQAIDELTAKEKDVINLYNEYQSLMSKSSAYGLNAQEKQSLLDITSRLVDKYGLEVIGIDSITGAYKISTEAVKDYIEAIRQEKLLKEAEQSGTRNERINANLASVSKSSAAVDAEQLKKDIATYISLMDKYNDVKQNRAKKTYGNTGYAELASAMGASGAISKPVLPDYIKNMENPVVKAIIEKTELTPEDVKELESSLNKDKAKYNTVIGNVVRDVVTNVKVATKDILDQNGETFLADTLSVYLSGLTGSEIQKFIDEKQPQIQQFAQKFGETISSSFELVTKGQEGISLGQLDVGGYSQMFEGLSAQIMVIKELANEGIISVEEANKQIGEKSAQIAGNIGLSLAEIRYQLESFDKDTYELHRGLALDAATASLGFTVPAALIELDSGLRNFEDKGAFETLQRQFVELENAFANGSKNVVEYMNEINNIVSNTDFEAAFNNNTQAAQQFFTTLAIRSTNIIGDTINQFEAGKLSVIEYGDRLVAFSQQQKEMAQAAKDNAQSLGLDKGKLEAINKAYDENINMLDSAISKWEELREINVILDENANALRNFTQTAKDNVGNLTGDLKQEYLSLVDNIYGAFTKLNTDTQNEILASITASAEFADITAENLKTSMQGSLGLTNAFANGIAAQTNGTLADVLTTGADLLDALAAVIKGFKYEISAVTNFQISGGFGINPDGSISLPSIKGGITLTGDGSHPEIDDLFNKTHAFTDAMRAFAPTITFDDYGRKPPGGGGANPPPTPDKKKGGGGKSSKEAESAYKDPTDSIINRINLGHELIKQQEKELDGLISVAKGQEDYGKVMSLTNQKIDLQKKRSEALVSANDKLLNEIKGLESTVPYNTSGWFDELGRASEEYLNLYNSLGSTDQKIIENLFGKLDKFQKAYKQNAEEINAIDGEMMASVETLLETRLAISERWIGERENFDDWGNDSLIDAYTRMLGWLKTDFYDKDIINYAQYIKIKDDYFRKLLDAQRKAYNDWFSDQENYAGERDYHEDWGDDNEVDFWQRALLKLEDEFYAKRMLNDKEYAEAREKIIHKIIDAERNAYEKLIKSSEESYNAKKKEMGEQKEALEDLIELTKNLIKWEKEQDIKAIQDRIDKYKEIIDLRKKELDAAKALDDFNKGIEKDNKSLSKLQEKLSQLERDNSNAPAIKAQKKQLAEDIAQLQDGISEKQRDKYVDDQKQAYDDDFEAFKTTKDREIEVIENFLSNAGELTRAAIARIESDNGQLYNQLITWNAIYGSGIDSDVTNAWNRATAALSEYGSVLASIQALSRSVSSDFEYPEFNVSESKGSSLANNAPSNANIVSRMKVNSAEYGTASATRKEALHAENQQLAAQLQGGKATFDANSGVWYWSDGTPLYQKKFHQGGIVGNAQVSAAQLNFARLMKGEVPIIAQEGEVVANAKQQMQFMDKTLPKIVSNAVNNYNNSGTSYSIGKIYTDVKIQGNVDNNTVESFARQIGKQVTEQMIDGFSSIGLRVNPANANRLKGV